MLRKDNKGNTSTSPTYRQDPFLLAPDTRPIGPLVSPNPLVKEVLPIVSREIGQGCHVMVYVQQATIPGAVHHLLQGVYLTRVHTAGNVRKGHKLGVEQVAFLDDVCADRTRDSYAPQSKI